MKAVVLYSGGMDSRILWELAVRQNVDAIAVWYGHGHPSDAAEQARLPLHVTQRRVDWLGGSGDGMYVKEGDPNPAIYIPGRNLAFGVLACCQFLPDQLWLGGLGPEDHVRATDKCTPFLHIAEAACTTALQPFLPNKRVTWRMPLAERRWEKLDAVQWFASVRNDAREQLYATWSCHRFDAARDRQCGRCPQCLRRSIISYAMGWPPEDMEDDPMTHEDNRHWLVRQFEAAGKPDATPMFIHLVRCYRDRYADDHDLQLIADLIERRVG